MPDVYVETWVRLVWIVLKDAPRERQKFSTHAEQSQA